jgi:hypothetical protein
VEFGDGLVLDVPPNAVSSYLVIGTFPLPTAALQDLLDARPYRSSDKRVLGGFIGEPDGMVFNLPVTVRMPVLPTDRVPLQVQMSPDSAKYWITPGALTFDPETNVVEFSITGFSGHATVEVLGAELKLPANCSSGRIRVVSQSGDFAGGTGCQPSRICDFSLPRTNARLELSPRSPIPSSSAAPA